MRFFAVVSAAGLAGLAFAVLAGFEEPDTALLLASGALMLAAPVAVVVHLMLTKTLTREERQIWIRELSGRRAPRALATYLARADRAAAARRFAEEAAARR
jgi:Fe2+ transport system protein B